MKSLSDKSSILAACRWMIWQGACTCVSFSFLSISIAQTYNLQGYAFMMTSAVHLVLVCVHMYVCFYTLTHSLSLCLSLTQCTHTTAHVQHLTFEHIDELHLVLEPGDEFHLLL